MVSKPSDAVRGPEMTPSRCFNQPLPSGQDRARDWSRHAIDQLLGDARRSADTHLIKPAFKGLPGISIYLKDESTLPIRPAA